VQEDNMNLSWVFPGITGRVFFDGPSVFHLAFWIFAASCFAYAKWSLTRAMAVMTVVAYAWEFFERYAEKKYPTFWTHPEIWFNSYISDPLMGVIGVLLAYYLVKHA
jgi:hypothetical protein